VGLYADIVLPRIVHRVCRLRPAVRQRQRLLPIARGQVIEVGIGSGLSVTHYDPATVERIVGIDPSDAMFDRALEAARARGIPLEVVRGSAEAMPFEDASADTVVATYTLCTIPDVARALGEIRRVLRPGGRFLFCEHGEAPDDAVRRRQRRIEPLWKLFSGGCHLTRPVPRLIEQAGFRVHDLDARYLRGWRPASYNYRGVAMPSTPVGMMDP
jgi:SAM-dependent methyltransferase